MNDDLAGVEEQGRRCSGRGGQFSDNPFVEGGDDPSYLAWNRLDAGVHWALAGAKGERAAGNGAAMRSAPLAFLLDPADEAARRLLRDLSPITCNWPLHLRRRRRRRHLRRRRHRHHRVGMSGLSEDLLARLRDRAEIAGVAEAFAQTTAAVSARAGATRSGGRGPAT
ncbi:MAG TPA: ADP-ribosylglycohydrolase family protein [Polyangia bacterium]|nr:ADP-ribosylglycohydrolase family protein [Polyangia bacterium]